MISLSNQITIIMPTVLLLITGAWLLENCNAKSEQEFAFVLKAGKEELLNYAKNPGAFDNVPAAIQSAKPDGDVKIDELEFAGTWLLYQEPQYMETEEPGVVILTSKTVRKTDIASLEIGFEIGSVQPVRGTGDKGSAITVFPNTRFVGKGRIKTPTVGSRNRQDEAVNSLITVGKDSWATEFDNTVSDDLCFEPPQDSFEEPVCGLTHLASPENREWESMTILKVEQTSCDSANGDIKVPMTQCWDINHNSDKPAIKFDNVWPEVPTGGQNMTCESDADPVQDIIDEEHIDLIGARINGSFSGEAFFKAVKNRRDYWKAELFDKTFQIFNSICPNSVIDETYMCLAGQLFFYHLEKAWQEDSENTTGGIYVNSTIDDTEWIELMHDMDSCLDMVLKGDYDYIEKVVVDQLQSYERLSDISDQLEDVFGYRPEYDHVMEINWLMANLAAAICTKVRNYDVNFLPRYLNAYQLLYFSPIQQRWNGTKDGYSRVYEYILGGFGMHKSITHIKLCVSKAIAFTRLELPYPRPMEQEDYVLLPFFAETWEKENTTATTTPTGTTQKSARV